MPEEYKQLAVKTKHKFTFESTDYNIQLLSKLMDRNYITSYKETGSVDISHLLSKEQKTMLVGYVKQKS